MGVYMSKQSNRTDYNLREYVLDTEADVANLPKTDAPGSTAFVIETSAVYMCNTEGEWIEI